MSIPLQPGVEIRCPNCRRWHPLVLQPTKSEQEYVLDMLHFRCGPRGPFYGGQRGSITSRHEVRRPPAT